MCNSAAKNDCRPQHPSIRFRHKRRSVHHKHFFPNQALFTAKPHIKLILNTKIKPGQNSCQLARSRTYWPCFLPPCHSKLFSIPALEIFVCIRTIIRCESIHGCYAIFSVAGIYYTMNGVSPSRTGTGAWAMYYGPTSSHHKKKASAKCPW